MRGTLFLSLLLHIALTQASSPTILLLYKGGKSHTDEFIAAFSASVAAAPIPTKLVTIDLNEQRLTEQQPLLAAATTIVTLGGRVSDRLAESNPTVPLLTCLSSLESYRKTTHLQHHPNHAIRLIDQPVDRMVSLIKTVMGEKIDRYSLIIGSSSRNDWAHIENSSRRHGYRPLPLELGNSLALPDALDSVTEKSNTLLLLPDSSVLNQTSAKSIFISAYRNNIALFGYSSSMAKAGALAALYSTPVQLGVECAEHAMLMSTGGTSDKVIYYPMQFDIAVNYRIARLLGIDIGDKETLHNQLIEESMP